MAYRQRWRAEIAALKKILAGFELTEERKWAKPCYMVGDANVVIIQGFKDSIALGFFQGALLDDPQQRLVQLGQVQAARVLRFTSVAQIAADRAAIDGFVRQAIAAARAGARVETAPREQPVPAELADKLRGDPRFARAFAALTPGRQRGYLFHFNAAKQSATRVARIAKATPAILAGRGLLDRA
nr:YdeI/OmpD-associated family protein [Kofleriaceae bacterium]